LSISGVPVRNVKLTLQYDGCDFFGWELQPGKRTIRGEIEIALQKLFKRKIPISAVSRTDAGVHALEQVVFFKAGAEITLGKIPSALNAVLPEDLRAIKAEKGEGKQIKGKTYEYLIYNGKICPPLLRRFVWHVKPKLNLSAMRKAAKYFIGKHDFSSFCAAGGADRNFNKTIHSFVIYNLSFVIWGSNKFKVICLKVSADGFLYKMVRNMVGTLVEVGLGKRKPEETELILLAKDRKKAGRTAPPQGLCLLKVNY
jgi:tRNA pseudouridine38-40 synthase